MAFLTIKRALARRKFRQANRHYQTDQVLGERCRIERKGKEPVEAIFYYPRTRENMPVFVQIHGGAWVGMDAVDDDRYCQRLSEALDCFVVNVNYKRLYENSFPYAQEEIVDVVKWLKANAAQLGIAPDRIVLSGGSAGGHITAGAGILLAQQNVKIAGQLMEVPFLDFTGEIPIDFPEGEKLFQMMFELFPPKLPLDSEVMSPAARATDETLKRLSPAVIIVCGRDPLHTQGEAYAKKLKEHHKLVDIKMYPDGYHGFGTDNAAEKPAQDKLREDCFRYKTEMTKKLWYMGEGGYDGKAQDGKA